MTSKEIEHYKAVLADIVAKVRSIRGQRLFLDDQVSQLYKQARHEGLAKKAVKEVINEIGDGHATAEQLWSLYATKIGFNESAVADDDILDRILGPA